MKMFLLLFLALANLFYPAFAGDSDYMWISTGSDVLDSAEKSNLKSYISSPTKIGDITILKLKKEAIGELSELMHEKFKRCGGFFVHESYEQAMGDIKSFELNKNNNRIFKFQQNELTPKLINEVNEENIEGTIRKLSSFKNRYYKSVHGANASNWIYNNWKQITAHRNDVAIEKIIHSNWPQPTIHLRLKGKSNKDIIIGGHADSIAGWWGRANGHAPGADDNASGIATITEILRILTGQDGQPKHNIHFMAYAAEEVGLHGSKEMAKRFKRQGRQVLGVIQFDMTNFNGSTNDIHLVDDFTDPNLNNFLESLMKRHLPSLKSGRTRCGYGCSDHASWNREGFPASFPFEAEKGDMNRHIHTNRDTIEQSDGHARHAAKFARLGVAFALELDQ